MPAEKLSGAGPVRVDVERVGVVVGARVAVGGAEDRDDLLALGDRRAVHLEAVVERARAP